MAYKQWVPGESMLAADINTNLMDQSVPRFVNASDRATKMPNPTAGQGSYLNDTGMFEIFTNKTSPSSWQKPWSVPWGMIYNNIGPNVSLVASAQFIIPQPLPIQIPGRNYHIIYAAQLQQGNGGAGTTTLRFQNNASLDVPWIYGLTLSYNLHIVMEDIYAGNASNSLGIIGSTDQNGCSITWARIRVYDVGPV